jgi:hypothetical protein
MSNKEHKKHLIYSKIWRLAIKIRCGQQISLIFLWQKGLCNCDYWFAYKICFELERKQHNECRLVWIFCKKLQKYGVPEILIQIKEVNTPVRFTPMYY